MLAVVVVIEPAPGIGGDGANLVVLGGNSEDLSISRAVIAYRLNVIAFQHRRNRAQQLSLAANGEIVLIGKVIRLPRLIAALDRRDASWKDEHNILPEVRHFFCLTASKTFSQSHQQQQ